MYPEFGHNRVRVSRFIRNPDTQSILRRRVDPKKPPLPPLSRLSSSGQRRQERSLKRKEQKVWVHIIQIQASVTCDRSNWAKREQPWSVERQGASALSPLSRGAGALPARQLRLPIIFHRVTLATQFFFQTTRHGRNRVVLN